MSTSRFVRRSVAVLASAGATVSLALIPAGGAHAAVHGTYAAFGDAEARFTGSGGGTCTLSTGLDEVESPVHKFTHGTKHASVDLDATFTNSLDSSDSVRVKGHADTSLTLHRQHGDLTGFVYGAGGTISVQHTVSGSQCQGSGFVGAEMLLGFSEHKKGYLYVTRDTKKPADFTEYVLINTDTEKLVSLDFFQGGQSHQTNRALLKPGHYAIEEGELGLSVGGSGISGRSGTLDAKAKATVTLVGQFKPSKKH
jgi:hypothetical protein